MILILMLMLMLMLMQRYLCDVNTCKLKSR